MARFRSFARLDTRRLALLAIAAAMFALWFGVWLRVLPLKPRAIIPVPDYAILAGVSNGGRWVVTYMDPPPEPLKAADEVQPLVTRVWILKGPVRVWDTATRSLAIELSGPDDICNGATISPDGRFVMILGERSGRRAERGPVNMMIVGGHYPARVFDTREGRELAISPLAVYGLGCFSQDGRFLACRIEEGLGVWDLVEQRQKLVVGYDGPTAFSPDGSRLACAVSDAVHENIAVVLDVATGQELRRWVRQGGILDMRFNPDGRRLVVTSQCMVPEAADDPWGISDLGVYDLDSGEEIERYRIENTRHVTCFAFRPDGSWFLRRFDRNAPQQGYSGGQYASPRGRFLMTHDSEEADAASGLKWWTTTVRDEEDEEERKSFIKAHDAESGKFLGRLEGCHTCYLSDDETVAACMASDGTIQIWDLPPRRPLGLMLALSAAPALLFTGLVWWRWGRRVAQI